MPQVKDILETMDYGPAPEANDRVVSWLTAHADGFTHFIDGAFGAPGAGGMGEIDGRPVETFEVIDPARETRLALVAQGRSADIDAAVAAARRALYSW